MDLATIIGLFAAFAVMVIAILTGASPIIFLNLPSFLIVVLGSIAALFIAFPAIRVKDSFQIVKKAFTTQPQRAEEILKLMQELSIKARREGILALEETAMNNSDDFLKRGLLMVVDGQAPEAIEEILYGEMDKINERHEKGAEMFDKLGELAPAFGMIGTLIGLVQMLSNMEDPSTIGPAMAVALLTTLYGSIIANLFAIPVSKKLRIRSNEELEEKGLITQGLLSIVAGETPRFLADRLNSQLPPKQRLKEAS